MYVFAKEKLVSRYKKSRLTYQKVSEMTGIPMMTVHRALTYNGSHKLETILKICAALKVSPASLIKKIEE